MWTKVPAITMTFWAIKILTTTVGETCADYLAVNVGLGSVPTTLIMVAFLGVALTAQLRTRAYTPWIYWLTVVLVSIVGTQITDFLTDGLGISLYVSTAVFTVLLIAVFAAWYGQERTLVISSINTRKREAYYWLAILTAFALGTACGDLATEALGLGFLRGSIVFGILILACWAASATRVSTVAMFWTAYVLTRPLGASIGDLLSQDRVYGGIGLGAALTSALFLSIIVVLVVREQLLVSRFGVQEKGQPIAGGRKQDSIWAVGAALVVVIAATLAVNTHMGASSVPTSAAATTGPLGDLSSFSVIIDDVNGKIDAGDLDGARTRVKDLETSWDKAESGLKPKSPSDWSIMDGAIDDELSALRDGNPDASTCSAASHHLQQIVASFQG